MGSNWRRQVEGGGPRPAFPVLPTLPTSASGRIACAPWPLAPAGVKPEQVGVPELTSNQRHNFISLASPREANFWIQAHPTRDGSEADANHQTSEHHGTPERKSAREAQTTEDGSHRHETTSDVPRKVGPQCYKINPPPTVTASTEADPADTRSIQT